MKPFSDSPAWHLRTAYLKMHRVTNRVLRPYGVTADQYVLLRLLCDNDGISQQELCRLSASDPTTIGRMLELMESKQLVRRTTDPDDRRTRLVSLTAKGRETARRLFDVCVDIREALETNVSPAALKQLQSGLLRISAALDELESAANPKPATASSR